MDVDCTPGNPAHSPLQFHPVALADRGILSARMKKSGLWGCEYTFGSSFIWRNMYHIEAADALGHSILHSFYEDKSSYLFPVGEGDLAPVLLAMEQDAAARGEPFAIHGVEEASLPLLEAALPGRYRWEEYRSGFEYIYNQSDLRDLPGKKYHNKRNHIGALLRAGDCRFEPMSASNIPDCLRMHEQWCFDMRYYESDHLLEDKYATISALHHFDEIGFQGGVLYQSGRVVAFCIGEEINSEVYCVHIEKAFPDIRGAYPMINREFINHFCGDYAYINREDDVGDEGLRQAKLSYYPAVLLPKYLVTLK